MTMTLDRLQQLLDAKGADLPRWPAAERRAAEQLIARDPAAAAALMRARSLDRLIAAHVQPADASEARVMQAFARPLPPQGRRPRWTRWPVELLDFDFAPAWPRLAALACVGVLGFLVGFTDLVVPIGSGALPADAAAAAGDADIGGVLFGPDPLPEARP